MTARQSLFNRSNAATIDQADKSLEVARADLETAEQDLIVRVSQAYFDVLGALDTLAFTRASKSAITEQLAAAKRNFEVGTATITDTREAQARFDLATAQEIAAENDLRTKRAALDQLVGRANVEPRPLAAPVVLPPLAPGDAELWVGRIGTHPSVRKAQLGLDIAKLETDKARAGHLPAVDLVGSLGTVNQRGSAVVASGTAGHNEQRERRRAAQLAAVCGQCGAEPHEGNGAARGKVAQRSRRRPARRRTRDAPGLQRCGVGPGAGEGVRSGRELVAACARSHAGRLPGRSTRQHRRAECADATFPDAAAISRRRATTCSSEASGCARPRASSSPTTCR